jgi:hypothetical protein
VILRSSVTDPKESTKHYYIPKQFKNKEKSMKTVNNEDGRSAYEAPTITVLTLELEMRMAEGSKVTGGASDGDYITDPVTGQPDGPQVPGGEGSPNFGGFD